MIPHETRADAGAMNGHVSSNPRQSGIKLIDAPVVGQGEHRSGWPYVIDVLRPLVSGNGILFDDFVERTFAYHSTALAHQEPWVGVFHHPHQMPRFAPDRHRLQDIFQTVSWQRSVPSLQLAITLSDYLAEYLRTKLSVPVAVVRHPTVIPGVRFSLNAFLSNRKRRLLQIGWYLRNTRGIYQLTAPSWLTKTRLVNAATWIGEYDKRVCAYWNTRHSRSDVDNVEILSRVTNQSYDDLLSQNIVFAEYFDVSASNLIVECIARDTPLVVNRHPAVVEYLGTDYPLFYEHIEQIPSLLNEQTIASAHQHLLTTERPWLDAAAFRETIGCLVQGLR